MIHSIDDIPIPLESIVEGYTRRVIRVSEGLLAIGAITVSEKKTLTRKSKSLIPGSLRHSFSTYIIQEAIFGKHRPKLKP